MNGWTLTRVWIIDEHLVVASTVEEAVALYKRYMGKDYRDGPKSIAAVSNGSPFRLSSDYTALISEPDDTKEAVVDFGEFKEGLANSIYVEFSGETVTQESAREFADTYGAELFGTMPKVASNVGEVKDGGKRPSSPPSL